MTVRNGLKTDELVQVFIKHQITSSISNEGQSDFILQYFKSCYKLHEDMRVWPPTVDALKPELTLAFNQLVVHTAVNLKTESQIRQKQTQSSACLSLKRMLQFADKSCEVPGFCHMKGESLTEVLQKVVETVKDPVKRFKLLPLLGRLLLVCSMICLLEKQQGNHQLLKQMLVILDQLNKFCGESVQEDQLPHKHSLILCSPVNDLDQEYLYVVDVVRLVLSSCHSVVTEGCLKNDCWQWLDTAMQCKELMKREKYCMAMEKLESEMSKSLDPEQKSKLLCLFAECYLCQSCPQLAIQTYKAALKADKGHTSVLFYLANVYKVLGLEDLELESLNLLVKILTDKCARSDQQQWNTDIDVIVMLACDIMPDVTLLNALHHFAKRCFELQRYKEAAEQYQSLLHQVETLGTYASIPMSSESFPEMNLMELIVETAEALVLAQKYSECINLCDEFSSIFITDDTFAEMSQASAQMSPFSVCVSKISIDNSQTSLFSQNENSMAVDDINLSPTDGIVSNRSGINSSQHDFSNRGSNPNASGLLQLCSLSRKRQRSASVDCSQSGNNDWWSESLTVRLLLSKADALVVAQGFSDDTMNCLNKAFSVLTDTKTSVFKPDLGDGDVCVPPPVKKHKSSDNKLESKTSRTLEAGEESTLRSEKQTEGTLRSCISPLWAASMISVALRMARAALKRRQFASVLNSCQLILQIEPHNVHGHYLKTLVLRDEGHQKDQVSRQWLLERGIDIKLPRKLLNSVLEDRQREIREKQEGGKSRRVWWKTGDVHMLSLDVACLKDIIASLSAL